MDLTEPSVCSCSSAAPKPSMHASSYTWRGREPSATASQPGKTKIGGPVGLNQNWWIGKLGENFAHDILHGWRELKVDSLPEEGGDRSDPLGQVTQEFAIVPHTTQQGADLL